MSGDAVKTLHEAQYYNSQRSVLDTFGATRNVQYERVFSFQRLICAHLGLGTRLVL